MPHMVLGMPLLDSCYQDPYILGPVYTPCISHSLKSLYWMRFETKKILPQYRLKKKKKKNWHDLSLRAASATGHLVIDLPLFILFFHLTSDFICHVRQKNDGARIAQEQLG